MGVFSAPASSVFKRRLPDRSRGSSTATITTSSRTSFCTSSSLATTAPRSPSTSSTLNVRLSAVFFQIYINNFFTLIKFIFILTKVFYDFIIESGTISSETTPSDSVLTVDPSSSIVADSTNLSAEVDSCSASAPASVATVTDSDVRVPAMAVLQTIASPGGDGASASDGSSFIQECIEQIDTSSDEQMILEAESGSSCGCGRGRPAALPSGAPLFCPGLAGVGQVSKFCFWTCSATTLAPSRRGPSRPRATSDRLSCSPSCSAHGGAIESIGIQIAGDERGEEGGRTTRPRTSRRSLREKVHHHLSGTRVLEADGVDFGGGFVVPEMQTRARGGFALPARAVSPGNIVLLALQEEHLRNRAHDPAPDVVPNPVLHDPEPAPSDRSSVVSRICQLISELECKFEVGVSILVPDNSSSYATVSSASPLPAKVYLPPGLAAIPQVQPHEHGQGPPQSPVPIDARLDDAGDDGPLHITYTGAAQRPSRTALADPQSVPISSTSSASLSSSDRVRTENKKSKFRKEKNSSRSLSVRCVVRVKATDMKLRQWPTTLQFAGWCRALRLSIAGPCDETDKEKKWVFAVEDKGYDIDDFKSDPNDPLRALDGKLAGALACIAKGEPARSHRSWTSCTHSLQWQERAPGGIREFVGRSHAHVQNEANRVSPLQRTDESAQGAPRLGHHGGSHGLPGEQAS